MASAFNVSGNDNVMGNNNVVAPSALDIQLATELAWNDAIPFIEIQQNDLLLEQSGHDYPYNQQFQPTTLPTNLGLSFDPNDGEQFEAFEVSSYIDTDAFWNA
jgi:hypothetical protein